MKKRWYVFDKSTSHGDFVEAVFYYSAKHEYRKKYGITDGRSLRADAEFSDEAVKNQKRAK